MQKEQTRQLILEAAGRGFRGHGFGGIGVDGLAKEAGLTSGAFYVHFDSKAEAFEASVVQGMAGLRSRVMHFQALHGRAWWPAFVRFYLSDRRLCDLAQGCTLQLMPAEVARADASARVAFEQGLREVAQAVVDGPVSRRAPKRLDAACAALATLVGAVTLSRAMASAAFAQEISLATEQALLGPSPEAVAPNRPASKIRR
jgi:TetR/AcrR family transcriptional regulator, transcriptional repressor for nem operon